MFADDFRGGAEMAIQALIECCPGEYVKVRSKDLTPAKYDELAGYYFVFGNFADLPEATMAKVHSNYCVIEYDFKVVPSRSVDVYRYKVGQDPEPIPEIATFFKNADHVFFMSQRQMDWYKSVVPEIEASVLSSTFTAGELAEIRELMKDKPHKREGNYILYSDSLIKGTREAVAYCIKHGIDYHLIRDVDHSKLMKIFWQADQYTYIPLGADTCPRAVIEAKLLGCHLVINSKVLHHDEGWFDTTDHTKTLEYLESRPGYFWGVIDAD